MENATKALMIAGAVLLAIMIIGIGMLIYNNSIGSVNQAISNMSQQEKQMFNNQFVSYEGTKSGSNVKTLISAVITSNNQITQEDGENSERLVKLTLSGTASGACSAASDSATLSKARTGVVSSKKYTVELAYNQKTDLVDTITITQT